MKFRISAMISSFLEMMKAKAAALKFSSYFAILLFGSNVAFGQNQYAVKNWQNLDLKQDGYFGISTEKAYRELLKGKKGIPVIVAVIDGGVDIDHEDLKDNIWTNHGEIPGNGKDDDHNGYIDDLHGWNFLGSTKGSFHLDNTDLLRELRAERKKNPKSLRTKILQADLDSVRIPKQNYLEILKGQRTSLKKIIEKIGKNSPGREDFKKYHYENEEEAQTIFWILDELRKDPNFLNKFDEEYRIYQEQLDYWENLDYDPRASNREFSRKGYGNPDCKGLRPYHGTFVAGVIAGRRGNGIGVDGIADNVQVMVLRAVPEGDYLAKDLANAIRYAADNGARVINLSFSKHRSSTDRREVDNAISYAFSKNVLIVHASGNDGKLLKPEMNFPSRGYPIERQEEPWIEVGASDMLDNVNILPAFSNYGKMVDVLAPGVAIYSTAQGNNYSLVNGTSIAAPVVSGLAALICSYYPQLTALQVKKIIISSVEKVEHPVRLQSNGVAIPFSEVCAEEGIVNAFKALTNAELIK